jgi:hypothetical protein
MKQLFILMLIANIVFTGCKKTEQSFESTENKAAILTKSYDEQVKYAETHLKQLGTEIGKFVANPEFVNYIHESVAKKFDEEYEVLVKDIQNDYRWQDRLNTPGINNALNAFKNLDGSNFYPQIYIPKFQFKEDEGVPTKPQNTITASSQLVEPIIYVFYGGNAEVDSSSGAEIMPGYTTDANGNLVYWGMVDSAYANSHEVWVYSINETVNNAGYVCTRPFGGINYVDPDCNPGGGGDGGGGGNTECTGVDCDEFETSANTPFFPELGHGKTSFKIEKMTIKDPKESWLSGAAEVSIRAKLHCHNNRKEGAVYPAEQTDYRSKQYSSLVGKQIYKFKRKDIRQQNQIYVNYTVEEDWQYSNFYKDPIYCDFVIFEKDAWPAKKNLRNGEGRNDLFQSPSITTTSWKQNYRSAESKNYDSWNQPYRSGTFCSVPNHTNFGLFGFSIDGANVIIVGNQNSCTFNVIRF